MYRVFEGQTVRLYRKLRGTVGCIGTSGVGRTDIAVCTHKQQGSRGNVQAGVSDVKVNKMRIGGKTALLYGLSFLNLRTPSLYIAFACRFCHNVMKY